MDTPRVFLSSLVSTRLRRFLLKALCGMACLAVLASLLYGALLFWLQGAALRALPQLDGAIHLSGLSAAVNVHRDEHGVPHIEAATQNDLFLAQGYVTAQDRLWQMDMLRRDAEGELAEILGPSMLAQDKAQRLLGLAHEARRVYENLPADERARFDAYARGVNLYIDQHGANLPPEFRMLFYRPRVWSGVDSLAIGMVMVQMLDTHWYTKLTREHVSAKLHDATLEADLYPVGSWRDRPPTGILHDLNRTIAPSAPPAASENNEEENEQSRALPVFDPHALLRLLQVPDCDGCAVGSNNWVVSGAHTASGHAMLANDMHLGLSVPSVWYMADLKAPGYHAAGVSLPGMPYIIEGHNEHVAWGITALMGDVQDLYFENLDGSGNFERADETWAPLHLREEKIRVRGARDVTLRVESTDHGPLLNPILHEEKRPVALRWTAFDSSLNAMPIYRVNTASNWSEFTAAFADWNWPTLNIVYADDAGHIGYHAVGKIPLRGTAHALFSTPAKLDPQAEWQGYVPFDQMPSAFDPPSGFLATANARVTTADVPTPITNEWASPYRVERIYKALEGRDKLTPRDLLAVQTDLYSEVDQQMGHRIAYAIDHAAKVDARQRVAADLLRNWDGRLSIDAPAASILTGTRKVLWQMILEPKLGKSWIEYQWLASDFALEEIVMHARPAWLPRNQKSWDDLLAAAVAKALQDGAAPRDLRQWRYGDWHAIELEHPLAKFLPFVSRRIDVGRQSIGGDATTVEQIGHTVAPSQRFIMDWGNVDGSTENIVLGQSGNPYSAHYRDQWSYWYTGTTFALPFSAPAVAAHTWRSLQLLP